ncbi:MAG: hypothetical protein K0R54_1055 [Clostridiaceae bacterium]|jgi:hypothetical protein|nr:hypothetical protein [Clostridiaceae bacterium]
MSIFTQKKLFKIKTTEKIQYFPTGISKILHFNFSKNNTGIGYHSFNYIPQGITGWTVNWLGREWFSPDDNQEGLEHFIPRKSSVDSLNVLIPINKLNGHYSIIE